MLCRQAYANPTEVATMNDPIQAELWQLSAHAAETALLRLNDTPPAGAVFAGWDATPMKRDSAVSVQPRR